MLSGYTCPEQDLDLHLPPQNHFDSGFNSLYDEGPSFQSDVFHYPDPQSLQSVQSHSVYSHSSSTDVPSQWGPMEPNTPQLQCSSLGFTSRDVGPGTWSSAGYDFSSNGDVFFQFYPNSYQENQSFLSPSTPGPSPHYPQTPFVTSSSNETNAERLGFQTFVDFPVTPETNMSHKDLIQDQTKQKRGARRGGGRGGRPRKSRTDKIKEKNPAETVTADASIAVVMPPSLPGRRGQRGQGQELCCGLIRRTVTDGDRGHYTPPPMLCPERRGSGLHCSNVYSRGQHDPVSIETTSLGTLTSGAVSPRINIGRSFQAEAPPIRDRRHAHADSHNALLLWRPLKELELSVNQQRVEALLKLARSSVVPGRGADPEDALLLLSESRGDFLQTVEKLLSFPRNNKKQAHRPLSPTDSI